MRWKSGKTSVNSREWVVAKMAVTCRFEEGIDRQSRHLS